MKTTSGNRNAKRTLTVTEGPLALVNCLYSFWQSSFWWHP